LPLLRARIIDEDAEVAEEVHLLIRLAATPDSEDGVFYEDDDGGDDNKDDDDEKMDDVPPATVKTENVAPNNYDEDAATAAALAASLANEEAKWSWPGLDDIVQLSAMVAAHARSIAATATTAFAGRATIPRAWGYQILEKGKIVYLHSCTPTTQKYIRFRDSAIHNCLKYKRILADR
jgi:hypothetical protein